MNTNIKNIKIYPQCNSFDPETMEPERHLKRRLQEFDEKLNFSKWEPKKLLCIGAGKGYFLHYFKSVKYSEAIEFLENIKLAPHTKLFKNKFLDCLGLKVADLVLGLRVCHYIYHESFSQLYLIKCAMLCKDRFLFESPLDFSKSDCNGITAPIIKAKENYSKRAQDNTEEGFFNILNKFFIVENRFKTVAGHNYECLNLKRKLPPIIKMENATLKKRERKGNLWVKTGYLERTLFEYITILQYLGQDDIIVNLIEDTKTGEIVGLTQKHLENNKTKEENKNDCYKLFFKLFSFLGPINYIPVDIVPQNIINGYLIDVGLCRNARITFNDNDFVNKIFHNDIILHHKQVL